jgi:hypothetical protein
MTAEDLRDRLLASAIQLGWPADVKAEFVSPQFRGRPDASTAPLPEIAYGIRLGAYPVIVAPVTLGKKTEMQETLRRLHSQMVIARSYMDRTEVINAHIFLCAVNPSLDTDWRTVIDIAERDETVCRKVVWLPDPNRLDPSYAEFRARTFLAAPWEKAMERHDARLDQVQGLAATLLTEVGLPEAVAAAWIDIVDQAGEDLDAMVERLVRARETHP